MGLKKVFLVDGSGIIFRAYFAFLSRPLTTAAGEPTSAIFGTLRMLLPLLREHRPDYIAVAFDLSRDTFRRELYPEYKAHREETPPDLKAQIPATIELLREMGIPVLETPGFEADDIIGTLAEKLKKDYQVTVFSGDKDLLQLVGGNVAGIRPGKGIGEAATMDREAVKALLGVWPEQIPDYLAITGDASDNIPGVRGIGDKGAGKLLSEYPTLEAVYENIDKIAGAAQKKLLDSRDMAFLSKRLATIRLDMELDVNEVLKPFEPSALLTSGAVRLLERWELLQLIADIRKLSSVGTEAPVIAPPSDLAVPDFAPETSIQLIQGDYRMVKTRKELTALVDACRAKGGMSLDTETTSHIPFEAELVGMSISLREGEGAFVPMLFPAKQEFSAAEALEAFRALLEDASVRKIGQNLKFEELVFRAHGVTLRGIAFDTMIAAYLLNPSRQQNNLDALLREYLGLSKTPFNDLVRKGAGEGSLFGESTILDVPERELTDYACGDSDGALRLEKKLAPMLESAKLLPVFRDIEIPLIPVLAEMEFNGIGIDTGKLKSLSVLLRNESDALEKKIFELAGHAFNVNSPQQLAKVLFEEQGLPALKKTSTGKASTDEEVLEELSASHPLPEAILRYRTVTKLRGTYVDALPLLASRRDGRVHTSFNQTVAATGRLSSTDPNLQNIPVRDPLGKEIRAAFTAPAGSVLVSADYSQIELRVLAHFCGDETMREAFATGVDIHRRTASLVFHVPESEVTDEMRRKAKSVNFGIIYGLQAFGLSRQLGIPQAEAKQFIADYFRHFPRVRAFVEQVLKDAAANGEVRTLSGRHRRFPELLGKPIKNIEHLSGSQRMALNTVVQGSAADIIKMAMNALPSALLKAGLSAKPLLQIHDELVLEVPAAEAEMTAAVLKGVMENVVKLEVPLTVEVGTGRSWAEAH
jgi:DNA polymerase-1